MNELTCREMLDFLADYHDGHLPPSVQARFELHLSLCPACVNYLHNYQQTIRLAKHSAPAALPLPEGLVQAILAAKEQ